MILQNNIRKRLLHSKAIDGNEGLLLRKQKRFTEEKNNPRIKMVFFKSDPITKNLLKIEKSSKEFKFTPRLKTSMIF